MNISILGLLGLLLIGNSYAFYLHKRAIDAEVIVESHAKFSTPEGEAFPDEFHYKFQSADGQQFDLKFVQIGKLTDDKVFEPDVYVPNQRNGVDKVLESKINYKQYREVGNHATATLVRSSDINDDIESEHEYRMLINIMDQTSGSEYNVAPVLVESEDGQKSIKHAILKREVSDINDDTITLDEFEKLNGNMRSTLKKHASIMREKKNLLKKRAVNGSPLQLYVEYMIAADVSILNKYKSLLSTTNDTLALQYLRVHYAQIVNAVNQRYLISLQNDADMKITVVLKALLIELSASQSNWTNPLVVGDANYTTYNGREVIVTNKALPALQQYINSLNLTFTFDHCVGTFNKDLWSPTTTQTPDVRSGVSGYAIVSGVCSVTGRFSLVEESGFNSISVLGHELGHNLGSPHDTSTACPASSNYLMTAVIGAYGNLQNVWRFSQCSIDKIKVTILSNNSTASTTGSCLTNVPTGLPTESTYFNTYLPGQLWSTDQQCKAAMNYAGSTASGCTNTDICNTLYCSASSGYCFATEGWGALDGSTCASGKVCYRGSCVNSTTVITTPNLAAASLCSPNPCLNGGACVATYTLYQCICLSGFTGQKCETTISGK